MLNDDILDTIPDMARSPAVRRVLVEKAKDVKA